MSLLGRTEGMLVDPIYTAKGLSGLLSDVRAGRYATDDTVVFWHTGGLPALFAHPDEVVAAGQFRGPGPVEGP